MGVETDKAGGAPQLRRRGKRWLVVLAAVNLAVVGLVAAPSQAQTVTCTGTMSDQTISASLVVPVGSQCHLVDVVVDGRATVNDFADLFLTRSRVMGPVTVGASSYLETTDSRVDGMTTLNQSFGLNATRSRFNRLVWGQDAMFILSNDSTHWGGIRSSHGQVAIDSGVVIGSVSTTDSEYTDLYDTAVFGPVSITRAEYGSVICHMGAALTVSVRDSSSVIHVGSASTFANCGFNLMGSLTVNDNVGAEIEITGNIIAGNLECTGNNPAPHGTFNLVGGSRIGQCASLSPAPSAATTGMTPTGEDTTAPRDQAIRDLIAQRLGS